jgi:toxin FitB
VFLIDTNVISETTRAHPNPGVIRWLRAQDRLNLPAVVAQGLAFGVARASAARRPLLEAWFDALLESPATAIVPFDREAALNTARLLAARIGAGRPISWPDAQIAGTGVARGAVVVTRNTRDFEGLGVAILDPFAP